MSPSDGAAAQTLIGIGEWAARRKKKKIFFKKINQQKPLGEGYFEALPLRRCGRCGGLGHGEAGEESRVREHARQRGPWFMNLSV